MFSIAKRFVAIGQGNYYFTSNLRCRLNFSLCFCKLRSSICDFQKDDEFFAPYHTPSILNNENYIYCSKTIESAGTSQISRPPYQSLPIFLIGIPSMQGSTATTRHGVTWKRNTKRLKHTGNLFRKNLQLKDVC